jgi:RNA polymerase sigma-70 factor (ECF subfamily)
VAYSTVERNLLQRCLAHQSGAWNDFVDRYLGLLYHVIRHTSHLRSVPLRPEDIEDLAAEVLLQIVGNDYAVLRLFKGESSLATYLTVVARRICVNELAKRAAGKETKPLGAGTDPSMPAFQQRVDPRVELGLENMEEVQKLLSRLPSKERDVLRLYYLEGHSYEEISTDLDLPVNSIGPILSRARKKLRAQAKAPSAPSRQQDT